MSRRNENVLQGRRLAAIGFAMALSAGLTGVSATADAQTYAAENAGTAPQAAGVTPAAGQAKPRAPGIRWEHTVRQISPGKWTGPRLPDGQPDIQGDWSNTIANQNNWTDPQGGIPGDPTTRNHHLGARGDRAPSRVSDPTDGQVPFQDWARARQQEFLAHLFNPIRPEYVEPFARCAPGGVPKSFTWHGYEVRQFPGYVVFLFSSGTRIIHLDGKPHLPEEIKLWNGDSRGHWEGNTLVVDVSNNNAKARFARTGEFASEQVKIEERYIFDNDRRHYNYQATITDPTVYTRPWTATIPARRYTVDDAPDDWHYEVPLANVPGKERIPDHFERTCVENNGGFGRVAVPSAAANTRTDVSGAGSAAIASVPTATTPAAAGSSK
jgi:hypothetical protein